MKQERIQKLLEFLEETPGDLFVKFALAMEYSSETNMNKAEQILREIISADKDYVPAYFQLGKILEHSSRIAEALSFFEKGLELAKQKNDAKNIREFQAAIDALL
jgi:Tfp pilus assembly protein PilF